jgi:hypothetical protein
MKAVLPEVPEATLKGRRQLELDGRDALTTTR